MESRQRLKNVQWEHCRFSFLVLSLLFIDQNANFFFFHVQFSMIKSFMTKKMAAMWLKQTRQANNETVP